MHGKGMAIMSVRCQGSKLVFATLAIAVAVQCARGDDWPQWLGPERDGIWRENGILAKFPAGGPKIRWRTPIGAGYSGPAVAHGKVFITDRILDARAQNPASPFKRNPVSGSERVLCLDAESGKVIWTYEYPCLYRVSYAAGPRTTPSVSEGKVYTIGTMGNLLCLDANTGKVIWSKEFVKDLGATVPMWGFSASPLVDGNKLICLAGGEGSLVVAFDKATGDEIWRALSAKDSGYCPPVILEFGGKRQLIIWNPDSVNGLDPETGKLYWSQKAKIKAGMSIAMPRQTGDRLLVSSFYNGSLMLQVPTSGSDISVIWRGKSSREMPNQTDGLHSVMATPLIMGDCIYGVCSYGELRCLRADTGERVWQTRVPTTGGPEERWATAFLIQQADRFLLFNEKGDLIIAKLSPEGYQEIDRAHILDPTNMMVAGERSGKAVVWSHPAFARHSMFARNDREIVCVDLSSSADGR
jgi:outer membrane protein assembly factor BamB